MTGCEYGVFINVETNLIVLNTFVEIEKAERSEAFPLLWIRNVEYESNTTMVVLKFVSYRYVNIIETLFVVVERICVVVEEGSSHSIESWNL